MIQAKYVILLVLSVGLAFWSFQEPISDLDSLGVSRVIEKLGGGTSPHEMAFDTPLSQKGQDLVEKGQTALLNGKMSRPISKYFICTNCHNTVQEDPDIRFSNPDTRLPFVVNKGIPFLQGSSFWGIVNRESWYNDDYFLKYGESVKAANGSLREAIQLCAIECAQGRPLAQWEEDAILTYFWTLELKMGDLQMPDDLSLKINNALENGEKQNVTLLAGLKSYYLKASPATFSTPLADKKTGYDEVGDLATGEMLYESSCRHCHAEGAVSDFLLDYSKNTFKFLKKNMFKDNDFSIYKIVRKGTYSSPGAVPYMPHYPLEKLSNKQMEGLRMFILERANK